MEGQRQRHLVRGVLAGVAGGLVASWVMNEFMAGPGKRLEESIQTPEEKEHARREEAQQKDAAQEDSTMKVADAVVSTATGGQHLSFEGKQKGRPNSSLHFRRTHGRNLRRVGRISPDRPGRLRNEFWKRRIRWRRPGCCARSQVVTTTEPGAEVRAEQTFCSTYRLRGNNRAGSTHRSYCSIKTLDSEECQTYEIGALF